MKNYGLTDTDLLIAQEKINMQWSYLQNNHLFLLKFVFLTPQKSYLYFIKLSNKLSSSFWNAGNPYILGFERGRKKLKVENPIEK